jgi:hypothetical protein
VITITFLFVEAVAAWAKRDDNSVLPKAKPPAPRKNSRREWEIKALPDNEFLIEALMLRRAFFGIYKLPNFRTLFIQLCQMLRSQALVNL